MTAPHLLKDLDPKVQVPLVKLMTIAEMLDKRVGELCPQLQVELDKALQQLSATTHQSLADKIQKTPNGTPLRKTYYLFVNGEAGEFPRSINESPLQLLRLADMLLDLSILRVIDALPEQKESV